MNKRQIETNNQPSGVAELRSELAQKIATHAPRPGEHATSIPGLTLYRGTDTTACYPATYEPRFNVFVQDKKRITLGGTSYLCDGSTFLLSSLDVPVVSQIIEATDEVPLLPVVDEHGRCVRMVCQADFARLEQPDKVHRTVAEISKPARGIILALAIVQRPS